MYGNQSHFFITETIDIDVSMLHGENGKIFNDSVVIFKQKHYTVSNNTNVSKI